MFRRVSIYSLVLAGLLFINACKKQNMCDCFKPRGETIIENRTVTTFTAVQAFDKIEVYYTQDTTATSYSVKVVTGKHLVSSVVTIVKDGALQIKNQNKCNFVRGTHNDVTVYITAPAVKTFIQDGVGNLYCTKTITGDSIKVFLRNSGDIHLHVKANYFGAHTHGVGDLYVDGVSPEYYSFSVGQGFIHAKDLLCTNAYIYYGSNGEARINVTGNLNAVITTTGNIYYSGNPGVIEKDVKGSGKLIPN